MQAPQFPFIPFKERMTQLKVAFWRTWEYCAYFVKGFFTGWGFFHLAIWSWIGAIYTFVGILSKFMDEEKLVAWLEKHPRLTLFVPIGVAAVTIGGLYWAMNTDSNKIHGSAERRIGRLRLKRVA